MLSPDDAALASRAGLPGLRLALDADAVADCVAQRLPDLDVTAATATYVRYKHATSCLVGYRLTCGGGPVDAYVRTHASPGDPKLSKIVAAARGHAAGDPRAALLGPHAAIVVHPYDHDLPAIRRLEHPTQGPALLRRLLGAQAPRGAWRFEVLRHNPERRWVARLHGDDGSTRLLKVHRRADLRRAVAGARAFAAAGIPSAALIATSRRHGIAIHEWLDGDGAAVVLHARAAEGADVAAIAGGMGRVLAEVHARRPAAAALEGVPDERSAALAAADAIAQLVPALGDEARQVAASLDLDAAARGASLVHGDCSIDQVVRTRGGVALIDLDRAARGDGHVDLAQVIADLVVRNLGDGTAGAEAPLVHELLTSYRAAGGRVDDRTLEALTAARLLRLAPEPFRRRQPGWAERVGTIVRAASSGSATVHG